jgi:Tfp pilus assembly protein PilF
MKLGRLQEPKDSFRKAPNFASAHYGLALILAEDGDLVEAKHHYQKAVREMKKGPKPILRGLPDRC